MPTAALLAPPTDSDFLKASHDSTSTHTHAMPEPEFPQTPECAEH